MDRRQNPEKYRAEEEERARAREAEEADPFGEGEPEFADVEEEIREAFRQTCEAFFGEEIGEDPDLLNSLFEEFRRNGHIPDPDNPRSAPGRGKSAGDPESPSAKHAASKLKNLYRDLVRRLHPDRQEEMTPRMEELWHEVQEAYSAGDLERLETLSALCDAEASAFSEIRSVHQLQSVWKQLRESLKSLRAALRQLRKEAAWRFSEKSPQERKDVRRGIHRSLQSEFKSREAHLSELKFQISIWEDMASRSPRNPRPRRRSRRAARDESQLEFAF